MSEASDLTDEPDKGAEPDGTAEGDMEPSGVPALPGSETRGLGVELRRIRGGDHHRGRRAVRGQ
jgi:hypothetical protein